MMRERGGDAHDDEGNVMVLVLRRTGSAAEARGPIGGISRDLHVIELYLVDFNYLYWYSYS